MDQAVILGWIQTMVVLIIAITVHEFAHALAADRLGDNTPRAQGRISLNPADHLDPLGTVMMAVTTYTGFGIGWGKPVQYNPGNLRRPRWDPLLIAVAGPLSNILQALLFTAALRLSDRQNWLPPDSPVLQIFSTGITINLALAFFNLIPIPPLDGSKVLSALLPISAAISYDKFMATFGMFFFVLIAFTRAAAFVIGPPIAFFYNLLVGDS